MNHRKTILGILTILVTLFLFALALETVSFFIVKALPGHPSRWEFRAAKPLAYANSPYYSTQFLDESRRAEGVGKFDEHVRRLDNYEGKYIKIRNNHRHTTDAPIAPKSAVYVFGGSTVFSGEVPDTLTIPSFLQRELNKFTDRYFVINAGIPSINSNQQLFYLLATPLNIGDIVVFFDGVNDAIYNIYYGYPQGLVKNSPIFRQHKGYLINKVLPAIEKRGFSHLADLLLFINARSTPPNMRNTEDVAARAWQAGRNYYQNIKAAHEYSIKYGASFYHFVQPTLFEVEQPTSYERVLLNNVYLTPPALEQAFHLGYLEFSAQIRRLTSLGVKSFDASGILNGHEREFFLDFCHATEEANEIIARFIASNIRSGLTGFIKMGPLNLAEAHTP